MKALLSTAAILFLTTAATAQQIQVNKDNRTIAVTASETATADADTAIVHIGFQAFGPDEKSAYANGSRISNAIAKALADAGVPKKDIESQQQNLTHVQPYETQNLPADQRAQRQFTVTQTWDVKTKADDAAKILNVAVNAGANQSGNIDWSVADENALEAQAAAKALARARAIAEQMASGLGAKLGWLIFASNEAPTRPITPLPRMAPMMAMKAEATTPPLAINPRKVTSSATVYAVFAID
jgi:uncharacterized protein YggE